MASFLDSLSQRATKATSKVVDKAKDAQGINKLNTNISNEESRINAAYSEIGKAYVERHRADPNAEFAALIGTIIEAENNIASYKEQILILKKVVVCENCGAELPEGTLFCSSCGTRVVRIQPKAQSDGFCTKCGAAITPGARFCTGCGAPVPAPGSEPAPVVKEASVSVAEEESAPAIAPDPIPVSEEPGAPETESESVSGPAISPAVEQEEPNNNVDATIFAAPKMKFCINCGAKLEEGDLFCTECGVRIE